MNGKTSEADMENVWKCAFKKIQNVKNKKYDVKCKVDLMRIKNKLSSKNWISLLEDYKVKYEMDYYDKMSVMESEWIKSIGDAHIVEYKDFHRYQHNGRSRWILIGYAYIIRKKMQIAIAI